ncbi:hypothetical protein MJ579_26865 [Klebsiella pneumoniae]|nr:hypothetical protein MJ579_26865 [Klebsiella pneumoniae]
MKIQQQQQQSMRSRI